MLALAPMGWAELLILAILGFFGLAAVTGLILYLVLRKKS